MPLQRLTLANIGELDNGLALETFQTALKRAVKDCLDRPGDKRARKVTLQMNVTPVAQIQGNAIDCDGAKGVFLCKCRIPDYETREVDFGVQQTGDLLFNPDSPNDHKQITLLE
ncbi:MAG: hypothetical protein ABSG68_24285 [Thermoguttaceae bacterium]|jgi:hypothetical protein